MDTEVVLINKKKEKIKLTQGLALIVAGAYLLVNVLTPGMVDYLKYYGTHEFYKLVLIGSVIVVAYSVVLLVFGIIKKGKAGTNGEVSVAKTAMIKAAYGVVFLVPLAISLYHLIAEYTLSMTTAKITSYLGTMRIISIVVIAIGIIEALMALEEMVNGRAKVQKA